MRAIWALVAANLRKSKGQTINLLLFVLLAVMFLNVGLVLYFGANTFFEERAEELHAAHLTVIEQSSDAARKGLQYLKGYPGVTETEVQNTVGGQGNYFIDDEKSIGYLFFARMDKDQKMDPPSLVGESRPLTGNAIYVPYFMLLNGGYEVGDYFKLHLLGEELHFTVAGGTEEIMFGAPMNTIYRFYVSDDMFDQLQMRFADNDYTLLSARMEDSKDTVFLADDYSKKFLSDTLLFTFSRGEVGFARTSISAITAVVLTVFAIILLGVSLIVVRFRITNNIEESMTNIGVLKAMGYRSGQIVASVVMQFGFIALVGSILGIVLSQVTIPVITRMLEPLFALVWSPGFNPSAALISLMLVLAMVLLISFVSARRINRLSPLVALRGGMTTHSFKKNVLPLDKSHGPLGLLLATKQILQNKKQAIAISTIIAAVTLAAVAGLSMHYNMSVDLSALAAAMGEIPDASFTLKDTADGNAFKKKMLERPEVRKALGYEFFGVSLFIDETKIMANITEDCALLEGNMLVSGRYPKHSNEIALGAAAAKASGKGVGDMVTVKSGENEKDYLVTGTIQLMNNTGFNGLMTGEALKRVQPDFAFTSFSVYVTDETDVKAFIEHVEADSGDIFETTLNVQDQMNTQFRSLGPVFAAVAVGIMAATVFVVILTLYLVIKTTIMRRKRELGIQKALGFTTLQLMSQIALNFTPIILLSVVIGAIGGYYGLNPLFVALTSGLGMVRSELLTPLNWVVAVCIALTALTYVVSMLIAWRIRKISAYSLISE